MKKLDMHVPGTCLIVFLLIASAGCITIAENMAMGDNLAATPNVQDTATVTLVPTLAAVRPGIDPLIGVWRITNSQGYDDRFRYDADGTYQESFYDTDSTTTWIHTGTWTAQAANAYTVSDRVTGKTRTLNYFPDAQSIRFADMPHLVLKPYIGDVAAGVPYATAPPATPAVTTAIPAGATTTVLLPVLDNPQHLTGIGYGMVSFQARNAGTVTFHIYYNWSEGYDSKCSDEGARFVLAGPTIYDQSLYAGSAWKLHDADHTVKLPAPGRYSVTVHGCWGWWINIVNA